MARYRQKDSVDLAWNKIRRQITRDLDTAMMNLREEILNTALSDGWDRFQTALSQGQVLELEAEYERTAGVWVADQVKAHLPAALPQQA